MGRLRKLLRLPVRDRALLIRSAALLTRIRIGLWLSTYPRLERRLARTPTRASDHPPPLDRIAWAVVAASGYVPGCAGCLPRALAARELLRRYGYPAELRLGAARDGQGGFQAHAWVESDGQVVVGDGDLDRFASFESRQGAAR